MTIMLNLCNKNIWRWMKRCQKLCDVIYERFPPPPKLFPHLKWLNFPKSLHQAWNWDDCYKIYDRHTTFGTHKTFFLYVLKQNEDSCKKFKCSYLSWILWEKLITSISKPNWYYNNFKYIGRENRLYHCMTIIHAFNNLWE